MAQITIKVADMHCAACSARVEKVLNNLNGIEKASVNLATLKATVSYDEELILVEDITQAIIDAGYTPELVNDKPKVVRQTFNVEGIT